MRVLVAEDDDGLRSVLERGLGEQGYVVDAVGDGRRAVSFLRAYDYDVVVLDWRMPHMSGLEVLDEMHRHGIRTPTLLLTARDATADRVAGLDHGADDYLVKPFELAELLARMRALQRRPALVAPPLLHCGDLTFDPAAFRAFRSGEPVTLTTIELRLLELLMRRSPAVVSRRAIALHAWEDEADAVGSNTIDVHVGRLRSKLGDAGTQIETVRGLGYRMVGT